MITTESDGPTVPPRPQTTATPLRSRSARATNADERCLAHQPRPRIHDESERDNDPPCLDAPSTAQCAAVSAGGSCQQQQPPPAAAAASLGTTRERFVRVDMMADRSGLKPSWRGKKRVRTRTPCGTVTVGRPIHFALSSRGRCRADDYSDTRSGERRNARRCMRHHHGKSCTMGPMKPAFARVVSPARACALQPQVSAPCVHRSALRDLA